MNKEGLSKYIINTFILPEQKFQPLIKSLIRDDKLNAQHTEIIKSLDNSTKKYLLNSYNGNNKIKIEPIAQLNNYSQQQLIQIFNKNLNNKNKKEFNQIITQHQIKEISTPYLSSSFNANVLTNESDNNLKSKNECLDNIKNVRTKLMPHYTSIIKKAKNKS